MGRRKHKDSTNKTKKRKEEKGKQFPQNFFVVSVLWLLVVGSGKG